MIDLECVFTESHKVQFRLVDGVDELHDLPDRFELVFGAPKPGQVRHIVNVLKAHVRATGQLTRYIQVPKLPFSPLPPDRTTGPVLP